MTPSIRKMLITDTAAVAAIESQVSIEPWSEKLFADCILVGYSCWVVAIEQTVIGFGLLSCAAGEAHILNVAITSNWRQQGLGRALMQHLVQVATELNADIIYLEVRESNTIARKLYQDLAFIEIGRRKGYYPKDNNSREDAITLALSLS